MKKLALVALILLTAVAAHAADLPDTPAAKTFALWMDSYNTHDLEARKAFLKANSAMSAEQIDRYAPMDIQMRDSEGKLEVASVSSSADHKIEVVARHVTTGAEISVTIEVEDKAPYKIARMGLRPL